MREARSIINPEEILHIEVVCPECKNTMIFPLIPPSQAPDKPAWHTHLCQCLWCLSRLPLGLQGIVFKLQDDFRMLRDNRELGLRFAIKILGEVTVSRQE